MIGGSALCRQRRHTQNPFTSTLFGNGDGAHRWWEVASRAHPVPDLVQVPCQVCFELLDRLLVHSGRPTIGFDRFIRFVHQALIDVERFVCRMHRVHPVSSCFAKCDRLTRPLCSSPVTEPSLLLRVGPPQCSASVLSPRGFGRLSFSLNIGASGSCSSVQPPASASRPLYAGRHPLSFIRHPAGSSQASYTHLVLTTLDFLTTRLRKVHFRSSLGCAPARVFLALFLQRSPPRLLTAAAWRWFEICS